MTYRHTFALALDRAASKAENHGLIKRLENLAAEFRSGGFDAELMARYASQADDDDLGADFAEITARVIREMGTFCPPGPNADDLLITILREIGQ